LAQNGEQFSKSASQTVGAAITVCYALAMALVTDPISIITFGAAIGGFLCLAAPLAASGPQTPARWTAVLLLIGAAAHGVDWLAWRVSGDRGTFILAWVLSMATAGFFWAFVQASFEDRAVPVWVRLAPPAVLITAGLLGRAAALAGWPISWLAYNVAVVAFMGHALWMLAHGRRNDLVEGRRNLRTPLMVVTVGYILIVQMYDIVGMFGAAFIVPPRLQAFALFGLAVGAALTLFRPDNALLEALTPPAPPGTSAATPPPVTTAIDPADQALANRLHHAMQTEALWRNEDLSIGTLAEHLKTTEHRLRNLINAQLGHRNFAAFVNTHRIAAAKAALADLENARKPVSAIAFDLGFGSLGPFNRAFKEATGLTPTAWRLQALSPSPNSENPG